MSSTQKAGKARPEPHLRAPRRWLRHIERRAATQRSFQQRTTSMSLATHGLRAAVGFPPRVMRRAGGNTPRRALAVRAEITRIPAPDGSLERQGVTFKTPVPFDAAAAKTGIMHVGVGGFHRAHQLVRAPRKSPRAHPGDTRVRAFIVTRNPKHPTQHENRRDGGVAKTSRRSRGRRARTRREARDASRRAPRDVPRDPRRLALPRGAAMRHRSRAPRAARRPPVGRVRLRRSRSRRAGTDGFTSPKDSAFAFFFCATKKRAFVTRRRLTR